MDSRREQRLRELKEREDSKLGPSQRSHGPAKFRETVNDTHKTAPVELFGAAWQNAPSTTAKYGSATIASNNVNAAKRLAVTRQRKAAEDAKLGGGNEPVEFKSVFKPRPEQEYVCSLAKEHRDKLANSEWALLDTLEVQMYLDERDARARREKQLQANHRSALDSQMTEVQAMRAMEEADRQLEKTVIDNELERYKSDQARKDQQQRQHNVALRRERQQMLQEAQTAKAKAKADKQAQEAAELDAVFRQLEEEKARAAAKQAAAKQAMERTRQDNEARLAARKAAKAEQRQMDELLMQQTIATLEKQERDREEKLKMFMASVAARADKAGQQAVAENRERMEREQRLIKQFEAQKEAEYAAKEAAMAVKKQKQKEDLIRSREEYLRAKADKEAAAKAQVEAEKLYAQQLADAEAEAHARKMAGIRARAADTQGFIRTQMQGKERAAVDDDTSMSARERELNGRLLRQAERIVGAPKQYSVKLY